MALMKSQQLGCCEYYAHLAGMALLPMDVNRITDGVHVTVAPAFNV